MSTAVEIEQAIETLPAHEYAKLLEWLDERRAALVDESFEEAIVSGKFDALAEKALRAAEAGDTMPLNEFLRHRAEPASEFPMKSTQSTRGIAVSGLIPGGTYNFRVRAVGGSTGYCEWSNRLGT